MIDNRLAVFLRKIVLGDDDLSSIRNEALDLLLLYNTGDGKPNTVRIQTFGGFIRDISRADYNEICSFLNLNQKINAIKKLRDIFGTIEFSDGKHYNLGLKEAKDTVDNWNFNL